MQLLQTVVSFNRADETIEEKAQRVRVEDRQREITYAEQVVKSVDVNSCRKSKISHLEIAQDRPELRTISKMS